MMIIVKTLTKIARARSSMDRIDWTNPDGEVMARASELDDTAASGSFGRACEVDVGKGLERPARRLAQAERLTWRH